MSLKSKLPYLAVMMIASLAGTYAIPEFAATATVSTAPPVEVVSPSDPTKASPPLEISTHTESSEKVPETEDKPLTDEDEGDEVDAASAPARWASYSNVCETFTVFEGAKMVKDKKGKKHYPVRHHRNRYDRKKSDEKRTRELIRFVAKEMGADEEGQYVIDMMAFHESTWNPEAIHILNGDLAANKNAWATHTYDAAREEKILETMKTTNVKSQKFWDFKAELAKMRRYKGNPYWDAQLEYSRQAPERVLGGEMFPAQEWKEYRSVWSFGYGLYGMNAVLFTHVLGRDAPPWLLCSDEGIEATVAAIWALRQQQADCMALSSSQPDKYGADGGSIRAIVRRWGVGQCNKGTPGPAWQRVISYVSKTAAKEKVELTWETVPNFGEKFPQYEMVKRKGKWRYKRDEKNRRIRNNPEAVFAHMREAAAKAGLLRPQPLQRKDPTTVPVVVSVK